jgi:hypothetical protein
VSAPGPSFEHLLRLSDDLGVFEHADGAIPRREHGYCVDDVARALLVITREAEPDAAVGALGLRCLGFVESAQGDDGAFRNRRAADGQWTDSPGVGDWWGRALWALGTAAAHHRASSARDRARACFARGATRRSPFARSMAFAALGAAEVAAIDSDDVTARALLAAAVARIGRPRRNRAWPWPEPRLTYANAVLPEALIAAGTALADERVVDDGLRLLDWLLETETNNGHLSVTPVGGWGPGENRATFDQQPIEAASLADACARAFRCTGDRRWLAGIDLAVGWFGGDNDAGVGLLDASTGGGYDGLTVTGCNTNQGAESTLALISTTQHALLRACTSP